MMSSVFKQLVLTTGLGQPTPTTLAPFALSTIMATSPTTVSPILAECV